MNYKLIFNAAAVAAVLALTGCTTPSMTYEPAPPPPPQPRYAVARDTVRTESTVAENKYIDFTPKFLTTPTIADLEVSDKKVTGSSTGFAAAKDVLEKEAVAKALAQKDGADVLVGFTFSYTYKTSHENVRTITYLGRDTTVSVNSQILEPYLFVTVTGYPARYVNFRPYNPKTDSGVDINSTPAAPQSGPAAPPVIEPPAGISGEQSIFKGGLK